MHIKTLRRSASFAVLAVAFAANAQLPKCSGDEDPCAPDLSVHTFSNSDGEPTPSDSEASDVVAQRTYYPPTTDREKVVKAIAARRDRIKATSEDARALRLRWAEWFNEASGASTFSCDMAGLVKLRSALISFQRSDCKSGPVIGLGKSAQCVWLNEAIQHATEGLKPVGTHGNLAPGLSCSALDTLKTSPPNPSQEDIKREKLIEAMDQILAKPEDTKLTPTATYRILQSKTERATNEDMYFLTVPFNEDATLVGPALDGDTYVRITDFPHDLDAEIEWKAVAEDPARGVKLAAGFLGFVIASYARQTFDISWFSKSPIGEVRSGAAPSGVELKSDPTTDPVQAVLDRLPPEDNKGTRYLGPIHPEPNTRYILTIRERKPEGEPAKGLTVTQEVQYLPRADWGVVVNVGVSADVFFDEFSGQAQSDPTLKHQWVPVEVGTNSTSFSRESSRVWERHVTPFVSLMVSPPFRAFNHPKGRLMLQASVGLPLNQPRGVSQFGLGIGWWARTGVTIVLSHILRIYDRPITDVGAAQLILPNEAGKSPAAPVIGTRDAIATGLSLSIGFDLAIVGEWFVGGAKTLFNGGAK